MKEPKREIPIYIISFNRVNELRRCLERYLADGYENIHIVDNASTNSELLSYLKTVPCHVHYMKRNWGHHVLWDSGEFDDVILTQPYVLTDPDILPAPGCPDDYVERFYEELLRHPEKTKVGFSLRLDDIPDAYPYKYDVIHYELFYWEKHLHEPDGSLWYDAPVDTTFAVYRPGKIPNDHFIDGIRSAAPYVAQHLGWYMDFASKDAGVQEYIQSGRKYSTSVNPDLIRGFCFETILRLLETRQLCVGELMQHIGLDYLRTQFQLSDFMKGSAYLLAKWVYAHRFFDDLRAVRMERRTVWNGEEKESKWNWVPDMIRMGGRKCKRITRLLSIRGGQKSS